MFELYGISSETKIFLNGKRRESLGELYELRDNSSYNCSSYAKFTVSSSEKNIHSMMHWNSGASEEKSGRLQIIWITTPWWQNCISCMELHLTFTFLSFHRWRIKDFRAQFTFQNDCFPIVYCGALSPLPRTKLTSRTAQVSTRQFCPDVSSPLPHGSSISKFLFLPF